MTGWPDAPVIYEVNTAVWLTELSRNAGRRLTLAEVPATEWDRLTPDGVDAVWLMGVWRRSPAGLALARANTELVASFRDSLADLQPGNIIGSPYCVREYEVDERFGGTGALAAARAELTERGARLMLDYVPNHVAPDHPWVTSTPELFVQGGPDDLAADPDGWLPVGDRVLAHGRDPYFPPWPDVVQLNAFEPATRRATARTLAAIAAQCDGIRCDMAMLMINRIFAGTWGAHVGDPPEEEFWPAVFADLRAIHPETVLLAEAYWDMEWELQQQGFDFCYDKRAYDRIIAGDVQGLRDHLRADREYQSRLLRFLENHDEPRIAERLPREVELCAAVLTATLPGATLWHEGQFEGRRVRPPVFLDSRPDEPQDEHLAAWYRHLIASIADHRIRTGPWRLLESTGWPDNQSCRNILAWLWAGIEPVSRDGTDADSACGPDCVLPHLIVVNLSAQPAQARISLAGNSGLDLAGRQYLLSDILSGAKFDRDGEELRDPGLFVNLEPWGFYLLELLAR